MGVFKREGSSSYYTEFVYKGRRVRESCGTSSKAQAEAYERKRRNDLHDEIVLGRPVVSEMTLREAVDRYVSSHLRFKIRCPKTAGNDVYLLDKLIEFFGGDSVPLRTLTTPVIASIRDHKLVKGRKASTVNRYLANLKAILRQAHRNWGTLAVLPIIQLIPQDNRRMRWLSADEEAALLAACEHQSHLQHLVIFLLDTGARLGEATGLVWSDVDLRRKPRGMVRFMYTKSRKPRSVPLTNRVQVMLERLHRDRPEGENRVFLRRQCGCAFRKTEPTARPFTNPYGAWKTAIRRAKLTDVVIHDLRHTFASRLVQQRVPLLAVSRLLGHASLTMTLRYAHLAPDDFDNAIGDLDAAVNKNQS